jgi:predicted amino acid racemase
MSTPRLEIRLDHLAHNATTLIDRLGRRGVAVCAVTKVVLGAPDVARVLLAAGASSLGESRLGNVDALRRGGVGESVMLIRSPLASEVDLVVELADVSCNTEIAILDRLSDAARQQDRTHGIVLMVELGDLREGIMPDDLVDVALHVLDLPGLVLQGIGTNLACQNGVVPDAENMGVLSALADDIEHKCSIELDIVSGGNSANIGWVLDPTTELGRINHLRLGESILLGTEPVGRTSIDGLYPDVFTVVAEVIESQRKPSQPWGHISYTAFGQGAEPDPSIRPMRRVIVALGEQDVDPNDLTPPPGFRILGASSDHLVLDAGTHTVIVGDELRFDVGYRALLRATTSPFVEQVFIS